tara:strand:- start:42411 stop:42941 length:531 start_codon:yes stop_codon:yes gene_type:complete
MNEHKRLYKIQVISIIAILISIFLSFHYYQPQTSNFCPFGESFNCNVINKSPYATIDGIFYFLTTDMNLDVPLVKIPLPNATVTLVIFLIIFGAAYSIGKNKPFWGMKREKLLQLLRVLLYISLAYAIYLAYVEAFILLNYCIFCILLDVCIIAALWLVIGIKKKAKKKVKRRKRR